MKKTLILCLLAFCLASAAVKELAVFPCKGDYDEEKLPKLREELERILIDSLPLNDYKIIPYDAAEKRLIEKFGGGKDGRQKALGAINDAACSAEGICYKNLLEQAEVDYGAWCVVNRNEQNNKWELTFYLYDVPGQYPLSNKKYDEKYNLRYNPQNINDFVDIMRKEVPNVLREKLFGTLDVKPAYRNGIGRNKNWSLYVNNVEKKSYVNSFPPGEYNIRLSHNCYETIDSSVTIIKGRTELFDVAKHLDLRTGELVLNATRNDKPADGEVVFVDGNQLGKTPYTGTVPSCSEITIGRNKEKVNVRLLPNERVVYTHPMSLVQKTSTFVAIGLNVLGAAAIGYGVYENMKASNAYDDYGKRGQSAEYYDDAWEKAKSSTTKRNVFYIVGGVVLASGIGVHIWF